MPGSDTKGSSVDSHLPRIVPKGLRSFEAHDADFFLELLPGARDRHGLPESIRSWRSWIESRDPDQTFCVGLLYGPSGCGKSSLIKAGLLPRISPDVTVVFVEATGEQTETRLVNGLRRQFASLSGELDLKAALAELRRGEHLQPGGKLLIVLDQFEQWLHRRRPDGDAELVQALRQCDGQHVQALLTVRDDFWLAVSRFMRELEIRLVEGENCALVDLFDLRHARRVLGAFGRAYGVLPEDPERTTKEQRQFLKQAIAGLEQNGKVICVRLSLFAEMVKDKPWTPETLQRMGGMQGVGGAFLYETFAAPTSPAHHRHHRKAVQQVLRALLPEAGTNIKGSMRSYEQLLKVSSYANRPDDFQDVVDMLDSRLRLITPTDPDGIDAQQAGVTLREHEQRYYQLAHDYLVPSLRDWLTEAQKATWRGRAELRLAELSSGWHARPENRYLPSVWEHLLIRLFTRRRNWTESQYAMMRRAARVHVSRFAVLLGLLAILGWFGFDTYGALRGRALVQSLTSAEISDVPPIVEQLRGYRRWTDQRLAELAGSDDARPKVRLRASLGLIPVDPGQVDYLFDRLLSAQPSEVPVICQALMPYAGQLVERLWGVWDEAQSASGGQRLRAACALASMDATSSRWRDVTDDVATQLVQVRTVYLPYWQRTLEPIGEKLAPSLLKLFHDPERPAIERTLATDLLADYAASDAKLLVKAIEQADERQFDVLLPLLTPHTESAVPLLVACLDKPLEGLVVAWQDKLPATDWKSPDPQDVELIEQSLGLLANRFAFCQAMPLDDFVQLAERLRGSGYRPTQFRPYQWQDDLLVAGAWVRDGRDWRLKTGSAAEIRQYDTELRDQQLRPWDVAGYVSRSADGKESVRYAVLWSSEDEGEPNRLMRVGLKAEEVPSVEAELASEGYRQVFRLSVVNQGTEQLQSAIWRQADAPFEVYDQAGTNYRGDLHAGMLQVDVRVRPAPPTVGVQQEFSRELAQTARLIVATPSDLSVRLRHAVAQFRLGEDAAALRELALLVAEESSEESLWLYIALTHARAGQKEAAETSLQQFIKRSDSDSDNALLRVAVAAYLGESDQWADELETAITQYGDNVEFLLDAARIYGMASGRQSGAAAQNYAERAVSVIKRAISQGYRDYAELQTSPDLQPLRRHQSFRDLLATLGLDQSYTAVWRWDGRFESREIHAVGPDQAREQCRELMEQGFRLYSISVSRRGEAGRETTMVWHRPTVTEARKEQHALRQSRAAIALLKLGQPDCVWPLLRQRPDLRVRSHLIHQFFPKYVDPVQIAEQYQRETEPGIRFALTLALGEFAAHQFAEPMRLKLRRTMMDIYKTQLDAPLHAATRWTLCQWGLRDEVEQSDRELAETELQRLARPDADQRQWYVTTQGNLMVTIEGGAFQAGAPGSDPQREVDEQVRQRNVPRRFALSATEVTADQWRAFCAASRNVKEDILGYAQVQAICRTDDSPVIGVTWYEVVAYCNWLSKSEGIPEDQWCYERNAEGQFAAGMKPKTRFLHLSGYRLATEAEWEFACRGGTTTSRYYGFASSLMPKYGWYQENSHGTTHPVARLVPNPCGLFDMYGNVWEWCHEGSLQVYSAPNDVVDSLAVRDEQSRILRGGAYDSPVAQLRSSQRNYSQPNVRQVMLGFRVARTLVAQ